jgi:hypothetical protein
MSTSQNIWPIIGWRSQSWEIGDGDSEFLAITLRVSNRMDVGYFDRSRGEWLAHS